MTFDDVQPGMLIRNDGIDATAWVKEKFEHPEFGPVWCGYILDGPPGFMVKFMWGHHVRWQDWRELGGLPWIPAFRFKDISVDDDNKRGSG